MSDRVALVTGASRGIGKAIAIELAKSGFKVLVNCKQNIDLARATADEICASGGRADVFQADVSKPAQVDAMCQYATKVFGFVDTIVNNAGISRYSLFTDETSQSYDEVMNVNLRGVFNVCKAFAPNMISNRFGRIINVSSMWGLVGASCEALYSASKAGVIGFTTALAKELGPSGITVNAVAPGVIKTDMLSGISEQTISSLVEETPIGRVGQPCDVAAAVRFLASKEAGFVTGEVINCSGGFVIK
ncbi:MAG: 3-oxoacyl-ACP reductase FabG [Clostridia bacterium]|nr:3-oxoacyl-ACP reductase FabG [Clostridia bacterium]